MGSDSQIRSPSNHNHILPPFPFICPGFRECFWRSIDPRPIISLVLVVWPGLVCGVELLPEVDAVGADCCGDWLLPA